MTKTTGTQSTDRHARTLAAGARELHCAHREHGICITPTGMHKAACLRQAKLGMTDSERFLDKGYAYAVPVSAIRAVMSIR